MDNHLIMSMMTACQQEVKNAIKVDEMPYLSRLIDVTIPTGIAPLNFDSEEEADRMDVIVKGSQGGELHVQGDYASFEVDEWHELVQANQGGHLPFRSAYSRIVNGIVTRISRCTLALTPYPTMD